MSSTIDISRRRRLRRPHRRSVFLSCRFADREFVNSLIRLLKREGFEVMTGKSANGYISRAILESIEGCSLFLCLMTRDEVKADGGYTVSPWVLAETGAALAFRKPLVLMVQEGVTRIGGLQGDLQELRFTVKSFLDAALDAVEQLESYCQRPILKSA